MLHEDLTFYWYAAAVQPSGAFSFAINSLIGDEVDIVGNRVADSIVVVPSIETKLGRHWNLRLDHTFQRLGGDDQEIFTANLTQARVVYNFNVRSFVRGIFQYFDLDQAGSEQQTLFTQLLFSYKINPRKVVFVGLLGQSPGDRRHHPHPDRPDVFPEARLRLDFVVPVRSLLPEPAP